MSNQLEIDQQWMRHALQLAERAELAGEVPVGAVLVKGGELLAEGWNQPIGLHDPTAHAEIVVLRTGGRAQGNYRLCDTTLYVTLEPCVMCVGAITHARVERLVFGAPDPKRGAVESAFELMQPGKFNHNVVCEGGVLVEPCAALLRAFFKRRR
ncbi:MAG: tRNA adenosine(34) deaminase TadA [Thiotrichaceae bacterium]|nr:tRNA adenosine(34) deaminase TadA [Thiotrichaceae bacterium]MBL1260576.1 tRNA adenosine(34) deaminase TadA [Thiotrichaceae bacterium]